ncbi:HAD family phosphatase [Enterobacter sp. CP102]|uniref:HAD family hydrolase n=1 Tax=Enterobacter sp. CP102 TaxID=2976431 RepID=UPI0021FF3609|nr:HAD family phosphatase [Enterobacter sp. CP102]UWM63509.1 HAD family phosphatase [Enterobacter sp. CP102]
MTMINPELVIFDCDGVLVDSEIIGINLTLDVLRTYGCTISKEEFSAYYSGMVWNSLIKKINGDFNVSVPSGANYDFYDRLTQSFKEKLCRIDGTMEIVSNITKATCICSNSGIEQIKFMLELTGLREFFTDTVFSATVLGESRCKPKPDVFLLAADHFQVLPANTVVIEDSVTGVTAAKAAGMYTVGFIGGSHTYPQHAERLRAAGADVIIKSMYELPHLISL